VGVSYDDAPHEVDAAVFEALRGVSFLSKKETPEVFLDEYGDFSVNYNVFVSIEGRNHIRQVRDEFYRNLYYVFKRRGITIPFPVRTVERAAEKKRRTSPALSKPALLDFMDAKAFAEFLSLGSVSLYGRGEHLLVEGEEGRGLYIVADGSVDVLKNGQKIASAGRGSLLGEMSLIKGEPVSADCVTASLSNIFFMDKADFFAFMKRNRDFTESITQLVAEREMENRKNISSSKKEAGIKKEQKKLFDKILKFMND